MRPQNYRVFYTEFLRAKYFVGHILDILDSWRSRCLRSIAHPLLCDTWLFITALTNFCVLMSYKVLTSFMWCNYLHQKDMAIFLARNIYLTTIMANYISNWSYNNAFYVWSVKLYKALSFPWNVPCFRKSSWALPRKDNQMIKFE